jgi:hypothetical protein
MFLLCGVELVKTVLPASGRPGGEYWGAGGTSAALRWSVIAEKLS